MSPRPKELPRLTDGHREVLLYMDKYFASFTLPLIAVSTVSAFLGVVSWKTAASIAAFAFGNLALSQISFRAKKPLPLEVFRVFGFNALSPTTVYLVSDGPMAAFYFMYLLISISAPVLLNLFHNRPAVSRLAAFQSPFWLIVASWFWVERVNWYMTLALAGFMLMLGLYLTQVMTTLGRSLQLQSERARQLQEEKEKIMALHEKLERQRASTLQSAKMAALGEMAGGVAHEINTPLAVVRMSSEQIKELMEDERPDRELINRRIEVTIQTTDRIARIVQGLRDFASDPGASPLEVKPLSAVIQETLMFCREKFREKGVEIELGPMTDAQVRCRPSQLSQAILNLLNNSFEAISSAEGRKWIRLESALEGDKTTFSLTDSGKGVPPGIRDQIFAPFFTTKDFKNPGLGLSTARGIAEAHQGSLVLDPDAPNTRFCLTLPTAAS